jgi:hypothetical protein
MRWGLKRYIAVFLLVAGVIGLAYRAVDRGVTSLHCLAEPPAGHFLAFCLSPQFGDFEHGAYYYKLEPEALAHFRRADVIFFGSSREQIALSTRAFADFFKQLRIAPYLFGFGYNEQAAFPLALVQREQPKPKAIVVLADPFFQDKSTPHVRVNQWVRWRVIPEFYEFAQKKLFIAIGARVCSVWPDRCTPAPQLVFRSKQDGAWLLHNFDHSAASPVGGAAFFTLTEAMAAPDLVFAEKFIAATGVPRDCVILSAAPTNSMRAEGYVKEMGRLLGVKVALPALENLSVSDGSHLTPDSAERWSAAMLADARDTLTRCAGKQ